jgi:hypothetical protein
MSSTNTLSWANNPSDKRNDISKVMVVGFIMIPPIIERFISV